MQTKSNKLVTIKVSEYISAQGVLQDASTLSADQMPRDGKIAVRVGETLHYGTPIARALPAMA